LLLTAGDNSERVHSEASFAALYGVSPVPASSGKVTRHRLNRGGDRAANSALHIIAIGRLRTDPRTKAYVAKRMADGRSKLEAIRCLKRRRQASVLGIEGTGWDVGYAVRFLLSDHARFITGQTLIVDGGTTLVGRPRATDSQ
jgi:hypothetical protein